MRSTFATLGIVLLVLCAAVIGNAAAQTENCDDKTKLIYASGTGKVTATPDQAIISLAVETENVNVGVAQQENAVRMDAVVSTLKAAGIAGKDLKTTNYNIIPVTEDDRVMPWSNEKVRFYRVTNTLMVTLHDVNRTGEIIDLAVGSGANRVNNLAFTLSDEKGRELRAEALTQAVRQARSDADAVAAALGKTIVDVKEATIGGSYVPVQYDNRFVGVEKVAVPATPIEPGEIDVTATISVAYIIA